MSDAQVLHALFLPRAGKRGSLAHKQGFFMADRCLMMHFAVPGGVN
ncbi:hypothetical protein NUK34_04460 [Kerstersia gyiorum]|jgi:hypothetical protein|nr:hypothetical protein [Kerstersia gyiorum]MCR4158108.1 hypothetical protein [Kerstersia gyiorum]